MPNKTPKSMVIDSIFKIDQAIGDLERVVLHLREYPEDAEHRRVPQQVAQAINKLNGIAHDLEKLRKSVL